MRYCKISLRLRRTFSQFYHQSLSLRITRPKPGSVDFLPHQIYSECLTVSQTPTSLMRDRWQKKRSTNKSQAIRDYLAKKPSATASEVVPELKKKGITVTPGLVSNIKSTSGPKRRRKKKAGKKKVVKRRRPGRRAAVTLSADDLMAAKQLADQLGGIQAARKALDTLERLA